MDEPEQFVSYLRMSNPGWFLGVLDENRKATITGSASLKVNGKQTECFVVQSERKVFSNKRDAARRETLWIDKNRFVVLRRDELSWVNNGLQDHVRIDLTTVKTGRVTTQSDVRVSSTEAFQAGAGSAMRAVTGDF